jgi:hypothetical protein
MNNKMAAVFAVLSILVVILSSGCTSFGSTNTGSGQGVIIENFETDFQKVYSGEKFQLQVKAKNIGSVDAEKVLPTLYNIGKTVSGKNVEISCTNTCPENFKMLAPDLERGTEGETKTCSWDCTAPTSVPKGLSVTFNPSVRLYYFYRTSTIKSVTLASRDELRSVQNQGKTLPSETISTSIGPVQLNVVVNGPIRYSETDGKVAFPINIIIQNTGGGVACETLTNGCQDNKNWDKVALFFNEDGENSARLLSCDISGSSGQGITADLWKGQSKTLACEVEMDVPKTAGFVQKNLKFDIEYDYFVDASTAIEVIGK